MDTQACMITFVHVYNAPTLTFVHFNFMRVSHCKKARSSHRHACICTSFISAFGHLNAGECGTYACNEDVYMHTHTGEGDGARRLLLAQ